MSNKASSPRSDTSESNNEQPQLSSSLDKKTRKSKNKKSKSNVKSPLTEPAIDTQSSKSSQHNKTVASPVTQLGQSFEDLFGLESISNTSSKTDKNKDTATETTPASTRSSDAQDVKVVPIACVLCNVAIDTQLVSREETKIFYQLHHKCSNRSLFVHQRCIDSKLNACNCPLFPVQHDRDTLHAPLFRPTTTSEVLHVDSEASSSSISCDSDDSDS